MHKRCESCDKEIKTKKESDECKKRSHEIIDYLDPEDHDKSEQQRQKPKNQNETKKTRKKVKGKINGYFVESIIVDEIPFFLCRDLISKKISLRKEFVNDEKLILPIESSECGYIPFEFTKSEIEKAIENQINKDKLLDEIKKAIDKFVIVRELDKYLLLADILMTYEQERINTLHFPFFVGETESGKSSALHLVRILGYRCLYGEDLPNADIYNFLGTDEEGAGTIAEDEAQEIEKNREKIRTYKNSYSKGSLKARIITTNYSKKQVFYKTFCPKFFAGEKLPEDKGFRERLAVVNMLEGNPRSNIKRLSGSEKKDLLDLRKGLLLYKIQNIKNDLPHFDSGLRQRDQELWEDFLRVVYGTKYFEKCKETVAYYTTQRHEVIWNSLEAKIFKIVKKTLDSNLQIRIEDFWYNVIQVQDELPGTLEKETFYPHDFVTKVTRNYLSRLFEDKYQARRKQTYQTDEKNKKHLHTVYQFKADVIEVLSKKYNVKEEKQNSILVSSGGSGRSGQLVESKADHVDDVDHLKLINAKKNSEKSYYTCWTCNEKGTEVWHIDKKTPNGLTSKSHEKAGHNVQYLTKEEAKLVRDYQIYGGLKPDVIRNG